MKMEIKQYDPQQDFERVGRFLIDHYKAGSNPGIWTQPRWEYMHFHPLVKEIDLGKIGLAEKDGRIMGLAHPEWDEGLIYIQAVADPVKPMLVDYAANTFGRVDRSTGRERLALLINEADSFLEDVAAERGFVKKDDFYDVYSCFDLKRGVPSMSLPQGYRLQSMADENDLQKMNQVLWRGFNHSGPAPEEEIEGRRLMQSAPNYRHDLTMVAVAPNGDFVSYSGIWYVPENRLTVVEPVATDPDYRRMGLGKAAVLEGMRRTIALGAQVAWVGSEQPFYLSMGFVKSYREVAWEKES